MSCMVGRFQTWFIISSHERHCSVPGNFQANSTGKHDITAFFSCTLHQMTSRRHSYRKLISHPQNHYVKLNSLESCWSLAPVTLLAKTWHHPNSWAAGSVARSCQLTPVSTLVAPVSTLAAPLSSRFRDEWHATLTCSVAGKRDMEATIDMRCMCSRLALTTDNDDCWKWNG